MPKDEFKARELFAKAAEQGDRFGQAMLGVAYKEGWGGEKSEREAVRWYLKDADQDLARAQFELAHMYKEGKGIATDKNEAYRWYYIAYRLGDSEAAQYLDELTKERFFSGPDVTPEAKMRIEAEADKLIDMKGWK